MSREVGATSGSAADWLATPWVPLLLGLVLVLLAIILSGGEDGSLNGLKAGLLVVALILAGAGASWRLRTAAWDFDERTTSAGMIAAAGGVPVLALMGLDDLAPTWEAARLALSVLVGISLLGAILILLPTTARKVAFSLIILFHFGGIMTAVTSIPPPNASPPWLATQLWVRLYRPYLQFLYQNNAYHFYSPEPGPPFMLWCHLKYEDGSTRWAKFPDRRDFATRQQYQRRLALGQSIEGGSTAPAMLEAAALQRRTAGITAKPDPIPPHPYLPLPAQYRPLLAANQYLMSSYVRYVARNFKSETNPDSPVRRIRVYRVIHHWATPGALAEGVDPNDPTLKWPYYQGEFDPNGNRLSELPVFDANGQLMNPKSADPFLYWMIPILYTKGGKPDGAPLFVRPDRPSPPGDDYGVVDYTEIHANWTP